MNKVRASVSTLSGLALDWAVAQCEGYAHMLVRVRSGLTLPGNSTLFSPSTDWALGGPIIEREGISVEYGRADYKSNWIAYKLGLPYEDNPEGGPAPLVAAMRCYVASRLGDTIEIPACLIGEV